MSNTKSTSYNITLKLASDQKNKPEIADLLRVLQANGIAVKQNDVNDLVITVTSSRQLHDQGPTHLQGYSRELNALEFIAKELYGAMPFGYKDLYNELRFVEIVVGNDATLLSPCVDGNKQSQFNLPELLTQADIAYKRAVTAHNASIAAVKLQKNAAASAGKDTLNMPDPRPNSNYRAEWTGPSYAKMLLSTSLYESLPVQELRKLSDTATSTDKAMMTALVFNIVSVGLMIAGMATLNPWLMLAGGVTLVAGILSASCVKMGLDIAAGPGPNLSAR